MQASVAHCLSLTVDPRSQKNESCAKQGGDDDDRDGE
jgi:hypothetical protein